MKKKKKIVKKPQHFEKQNKMVWRYMRHGEQAACPKICHYFG